MEGKKQECSPSSLTADLFGIKELPPSPSAGTFASIFPPPPMVYVTVFNFMYLFGLFFLFCWSKFVLLQVLPLLFLVSSPFEEIYFIVQIKYKFKGVYAI